MGQRLDDQRWGRWVIERLNGGGKKQSKMEDSKLAAQKGRSLHEHIQM